MQPTSYIAGSVPVEPGPFSRFTPPLEDGVASAWLARTAPMHSWILDPFGISPRLALESARAGYRVLVTANNPISRFLLEMAAAPPSEADLKGCLADLAASRKGEERLELHLQALYETPCASCGRLIQAEAFLWRKGEDAPYARIYSCPHCEDRGERPAAPEDADRAHRIAAADALHRSRSLERVSGLNDEDRVFASDALRHYLPRPLYFISTIINRVDGLSLPPDRRRALSAIILSVCDLGNTLWGHPYDRARPKQLIIPNQFREQNLWMALEAAVKLWTGAASSVPLETWPKPIPESGGICLFEGRLRDLANQLRRQIPIAAAIGALPRSNQAFWTLSALWAGWLWGREAVEPFKVALRRRRYDWLWNTTALSSAFTHLANLLPLGRPFFALLPEPEPQFVTAALMAGHAGDLDLHGLAMRTVHDPIQIEWQRGEHLRREFHPPDVEAVAQAFHDVLQARREPVTYLHLHTAGVMAMSEARALGSRDQPLEEAIRATQATLQSAFEMSERFVHYSPGEGLDTGLWGLHTDLLQQTTAQAGALADRIEAAVIDYLRAHDLTEFLELERDIYPRFPGLLTPSKAMIQAALASYGQQRDGTWALRAEDSEEARKQDVRAVTEAIRTIGKRLSYSPRVDGNVLLWEEGRRPARAFIVLTTAAVGPALDALDFPRQGTIIAIPGGRAALVGYKTQRDPLLAEALKPCRLVKFRLLRAIAEFSVLTRETFEEQIATDAVEPSRGQMMMF